MATSKLQALRNHLAGPKTMLGGLLKMKWTRKDVAVAATRVCGYSGFCWAYYKFCEGKPAMPIDDWRTLDFPPCNLAYELVEPWPMVDKLQAFVYEMKQKKKNDDSVFHPEPNNLELMEFF